MTVGNSFTISEKRFWKLPKERLKETADYIQVLPSLWRNNTRETGATSLAYSVSVCLCFSPLQQC